MSKKDIPVYTNKVEPIDRGEYPATSHDLLVAAVGGEHARHAIVARNRQSDIEAAGNISIRFRCSCGATFTMAPTFGRLEALADVPETLEGL